VGADCTEKLNAVYIYHPQEGYFVGSCLGLVFYESSILAGDLSPLEEPIQFESEEEAREFMDSWIASDGQAYITDTPPGLGVFPPKIIYQGVQKDLPSHLAAIAAE
jgi:hypothetical protein